MVTKYIATLSVLLALALTVVPAAVKCQVTPGGSFDSAAEVSVPFTITGMGISQMGDHYYRLKDIGDGLELRLNVSVRSYEGGTLMVSLFTENKAKVWDKDILRGGEARTAIVTWLSSKREDMYLKVSSLGGRYAYNITAYLIDKKDIGIRDAGADMDGALYVGMLSYQSPLEFFGYLASNDLGDDFVDYYSFGTELNRTQYVLISVIPDAGMALDAALQLPDGFIAIRNSSSAPGKPLTLTLKGDIVGNKTFYLVISNKYGHGGGGRYRALMETFNIVVSIPNPEEVSKMDREQARLLIVVALAAVAAMALVAAFLRRKRAYSDYYYEYGYGY